MHILWAQWHWVTFSEIRTDHLSSTHSFAEQEKHFQSFNFCRCSRCHTQRYCGRDCQVKHWSKHKLTCQKNWKLPSPQKWMSINVSIFGGFFPQIFVITKNILCAGWQVAYIQSKNPNFGGSCNGRCWYTLFPVLVHSTKKNLATPILPGFCKSLFGPSCTASLCV
jgi:hypothetical protein